MFSIHKWNSLSSSIAVTKGTEMNLRGAVVTLNDKVLDDDDWILFKNSENLNGGKFFVDS